MRKALMVSVAAAALIAATGLATAQGVNQGGAKGSEAPPAASPKGDAAAPMNAPAAKGAEAPASESKQPVPQHAQGKPDAKPAGEMKAESKSKASDSSAPTTTSKDVKNPTAETKAPASDSKTTGTAAASATAAPPAEKQTQIVSAIKQEKVEEATNVNFNISIGTAVPSSVRYYPLPARKANCRFRKKRRTGQSRSLSFRHEPTALHPLRISTFRSDHPGKAAQNSVIASCAGKQLIGPGTYSPLTACILT
jgi:hypothetical protein